MWWKTDEPETLSYDKWRERERKRSRRSFIIFGLMAIALGLGLAYVARTP